MSTRSDILKYKHYTLWTSLLLMGLTLASLYWPAVGLHSDVFYEIRWPRILTAVFAGAGVSVAGVLTQAVFRNALATPSLLGTEAGAALGLSICLWFFGSFASTDAVMTFTILGAALATLMTLWFGHGREALVKILLGGFALNALLGAISAFITSGLMEQGRGQELYQWLLGSFSARTWSHVMGIAPPVVVGVWVAYQLARPLDVLSLGEDFAITRGLQARRLQMISLSLSALLVGASTAVGGVLPFVGLVVPHFTRFKTGPYVGPLLLNSALSGAALTLAADIAARTIRYPVEVNVGLMTTIIGAPYFMSLLRRNSNL